MSLSYGQFRAGARLDLHLFADTPFQRYCGVAGQQGPTWCGQAPRRYNNQFTAERLYLTVTRPSFDLTLGDFYVSFGKGLALSLIQLDELGQDTTVRGGKLNVHHGDLGLVLIGGTVNVLNMDKATGWDAPWQPEPILGGRVEYNIAGRVLAGTHAVYVIRDTHLVVDSNNRRENWFGFDAIWGAGFEVPDLFDDMLSFGGELKYYDAFELIGFAKRPYIQMYHLPLDRKNDNSIYRQDIHLLLRHGAVLFSSRLLPQRARG